MIIPVSSVVQETIGMGCVGQETMGNIIYFTRASKLHITVVVTRIMVAAGDHIHH